MDRSEATPKDWAAAKAAYEACYENPRPGEHWHEMVARDPDQTDIFLKIAMAVNRMPWPAPGQVLVREVCGCLLAGTAVYCEKPVGHPGLHGSGDRAWEGKR